MGPVTVPAFTIAQTGHSGSAYTASVLYASGIACGHEQWWTLPEHDRVEGFDGDSSWLAMTHPEFADYTGVVFHQVRHPLPCIGSLARHYAEVDGDNPYLLRRLRYVLGRDDVTEHDYRDRPVEVAALVWLTMNRLAAQSAWLTWRVEAFNSAHVVAIAAAVGLPPPDLNTVRTALRNVRTDLNAHGRIGLTWDSLYEQTGPVVGDVVRAMAAAYGYEPPE
jgi:hypothetical protein